LEVGGIFQFPRTLLDFAGFYSIDESWQFAQWLGDRWHIAAVTAC
jgi:hypothetical protein